ncbi:MAG TPA: hypothetical protein VF746_01710 [Longimicrobium sp.]
MSDPSGWFGKLVQALRVRTRLQFFALEVFLVWMLCMAALQRGGVEGLLAFIAAFVLIAAVTVIVARAKD